MKNILIYGASGHSKMIVDIIHKNKTYKIIGYIDSYKPADTEIFGYKIIGNLDVLEDLIVKHNIQGIVIGIGDNFTRYNAYHKIIKVAPKIEFIPIIHPSAVVASDVVIPKGTVLMACAIVNADAKVGEFCILNSKASLGHDSFMSNFSSLASGATTGGNVHIGFCTAICLEATIRQNVTIGEHTVIGSGSLVLSDIGAYKKAFGLPISHIKDREANSKYLS